MNPSTKTLIHPSVPPDPGDFLQDPSCHTPILGFSHSEPNHIQAESYSNPPPDSNPDPPPYQSFHTPISRVSDPTPNLNLRSAELRARRRARGFKAIDRDGVKSLAIKTSLSKKKLKNSLNRVVISDKFVNVVKSKEAAATNDKSSDAHATSSEVKNLDFNLKESDIKDRMEAPISYANIVQSDQKKKQVNFRSLNSLEIVKDADITIPLASVKEVTNKFANTLYGYFLGKRLAFPVVENYVKNTWTKFGLTRVMMNSNGFFFFKFTSKQGMEQVLENGPWIIRTIPIILNVWAPNINLLKEDTKSVPVWVKLHNVPIVAFTEDGLSLMATKIGKPIMLDAFTSSMCLESWGRGSYARALIEVSSDNDLSDSLVVAIPLVDGKGYNMVTVRIEYEWHPPRCDNCKIFGHINAHCTKTSISKQNVTLDVNKDADFITITSKNVKGKEQMGMNNMPNEGTNQFKPFRGLMVGNSKKVITGKTKQVYVRKNKTNEIPSTTTSNQFDVLNELEPNLNGLTSSSRKVDDNVNMAELRKSHDLLKKSTTVLEQLENREAKNSSGIQDDDSDSDVEEVYDETSQYMASKISGSGSGFGNKYMNETWDENMEDDHFDDEDYNADDLSKEQLAFCESFGIRISGRRKE